VEEVVALPGGELTVLRPRSSEELLVDEAFEREELLPYWAELWPSGVALARALARRSLRGRRVVELGCGLGVASIAAARAGAHVLATDWSEPAIGLLRENAARNGVELETLVCAWEEPEPLVERGPWDLILAADVLYERRNVPLLVELLPRLGSEVLLADPGRPASGAFLARAEAAWTVEAARDPEPPHVTVYRLS
jgi:predicted nicotinamide N-methyase